MNKCLSSKAFSNKSMRLRETRNALTIQTSATIQNAINKDELYVTKLNYYDPKGNDKKKTLYNLNTQPDFIQNQKKMLPKIKITQRMETTERAKSPVMLTTPRQFYRNRMENILLEDELNKKKEDLINKINDDKNYLEDLYKHLIDVNAMIDEIKIDLDVLNNYRIYTMLDEKVSNAITGYSKETFESKIIMQRAIEGKMNVVKEKKNDKELIYNNYLKEKEDLLSKIDLVEKRVKENKVKFNDVKEELLVHYHTILAEGKDTRKEGLSWIIKEIWKLKSNILLDHLPNFLDEKAIYFLFDYSKKSMLLTELNNKLNELNKRMKVTSSSLKVSHNKENEKNDFNKTNLTFKTSLYKKGHKKILKSPQPKTNYFLGSSSSKSISSNFKAIFSRGKKSSMILENNDKITLNEVQKVIGTHEQKIDPQALEVLGHIKIVNDTIQKFKSEMDILKRNELDRLNKEFYRNNYQRRFGVSQEVVISAIVGEDFLLHELFREKKQQKDYYTKMKALQIGNPWENPYFKPNADKESLFTTNIDLYKDDE